MNLLTKMLTKNGMKIPLMGITFNLKRYLSHGAKGSCDCVLHPMFRNDAYLIEAMNSMCDHIRENYNMDEIA